MYTIRTVSAVSKYFVSFPFGHNARFDIRVQVRRYRVSRKTYSYGRISRTVYSRIVVICCTRRRVSGTSSGTAVELAGGIIRREYSRTAIGLYQYDRFVSRRLYERVRDNIKQREWTSTARTYFSVNKSSTLRFPTVFRSFRPNLAPTKFRLIFVRIILPEFDAYIRIV